MASSQVGLSFKRLFMDYQTLQGGDFGAFKDYENGFEFGVHFPLSDHFSINVPVKIGLAQKSEEIKSQNIYGIDAQLHWSFLRNPDRFKPYLLAGAGGVYAGEDSIQAQFPAGIGLDIRIANNAYFNFQSEYRYSLEENNDNFHHGIGFKYFFAREEIDSIPAPMDSDFDGIVDEFDACPTVPGLAAFAGCPDRDGDGVQDSNDKCPDVVGLVTLQGCPDSDGDGLTDLEDECPYSAGPVTNRGCPVIVIMDRDEDGVVDEQDRCPDIKGLSLHKGCPDTDLDGIPDPDDKCPTSYGPISNGGCPVIETKDREVLSFAMKAVQFELGKATLKSESYSILNQIADIMRKYPDYVLSIEGHTDNTGSKEVNDKLSANRAKACYNYLIEKGIPASRLSYKGYGMSRPIADNNTYSGRTLNRRVEFNLTLGK